MSESHGTCLRLKRHEDLKKVATYVKQQVREKSIEQVGVNNGMGKKYVTMSSSMTNGRNIPYGSLLHILTERARKFNQSTRS